MSFEHRQETEESLCEESSRPRKIALHCRIEDRVARADRFVGRKDAAETLCRDATAFCASALPTSSRISPQPRSQERVA